MKIQTILDQIDLGAMALPEFQRGYVWNRDQVRGLMNSLYYKHPVGSLLVWVTTTENAKARGDGALSPGSIKLLLDGQQRVTSLYGIIRGQPPRFFDGNVRTFTGLYFNLADETFEFYAPLKMKDNPLWIDVTALMREGMGSFVPKLLGLAVSESRLNDYINRLNAIETIKNVDLHIEEVTGEDKTIDVVVDIFNRVNSGGTKLSKGDLALAKICVDWPEARQEMKRLLQGWEQAGFSFRLDWLLRNVNTILTGEAMFDALKAVTASDFERGLRQAEKAINYLLNMVSGRLGLDHDRVLGGRYAFPVMSRYLVQRDGKLKDVHEQNKLLYWYVHSFLWGRFTGSTETVLNQDLRQIDGPEGSLDRLTDHLRRWRGELRIRPEDFGGWSRGARFYPLLYLLTRVYSARDWATGLPLSANLLGKLNVLQVHHIFPQALLVKHGLPKPDVNRIANFCFLTQDTNITISDKDPVTYFPEIEERYPGALASQWIPMDCDLWQVECYTDFLKARQILLAEAANRFLDNLLSVPPKGIETDFDTRLPTTPVSVAIGSEEEEEIWTLIDWLDARGLPRPELNYELVELVRGSMIAIVDAAWPKGIQEGYSQPVALLLNEPEETEVAVSEAGYRFFTSTGALQHYVETEIEHVVTRDLDAVPT